MIHLASSFLTWRRCFVRYEISGPSNCSGREYVREFEPAGRFAPGHSLALYVVDEFIDGIIEVARV